MTQMLEINSLLQKQFGTNIGIEEVSPSIFRIYAPFFYEDGDMLSMYLDLNSGSTFLRDFGSTLMRVAYTFDFESENKRRILNDIVNAYGGTLTDDEISLCVNETDFVLAINRFSQLVAKVSNINILQREFVKSLFYEYLNDFVNIDLKEYRITKGYAPSSDKTLMVDYIIQAQRPIFMFGVNSDSKASKVIISCLSFQREKIPFRSLVIHENIGALSDFSRRQIINAADKQFDTFESFQSEGKAYLEREIA